MCSHRHGHNLLLTSVAALLMATGRLRADPIRWASHSVNSALHSTWAFGSEIFWTTLSARGGGLELDGAAKPETEHLAMNPLLFLTLAVPLSCLALLTWLALLGVVTLGAIIHLVAIARSDRTEWPRLNKEGS
jgi:hypothetical protein